MDRLPAGASTQTTADTTYAGDTLTGQATTFGKPEGFRDKALASLAVTAGMVSVAGAYVALDSYGPSSRVVFYDYLPFQGAAKFVLASTLGAWLGARCFRLFRSGVHFSSIRLIGGCLLGGTLGLIVAGLLLLGAAFTPIYPILLTVIGAIVPAVGAWWCGVVMFRSTAQVQRGWQDWIAFSAAATVAVWLIYPQFTAFPAHGTVAEREVWAKLNIRQYISLMSIVESIPLIRESVGHVTAIAPASGQQQITGPTMDGFEINMVLDVVGEKGAGTLHVHCTIDQGRVFYWQPATWTMNEHTIEISTVANLLRR